jgi:hypothetical protein
MNTENKVEENPKAKNEDNYKEYCARTYSFAEESLKQMDRFFKESAENTEADYVGSIAQNFRHNLITNPEDMIHSHDLAILLVKLAKLREQMKQCAQVFRLYEELHKVKGNEEKAKQNADMAKKCEEVLL